jgi:hypothetical protein
MARAFYEETAEALRGFLPSELRAFHHATGSRNLKVWYASTHEHYEVQHISRAALGTAKVKGMDSALEVGFHAEHPLVPHNDSVLEFLAAREKVWRRALGRDPVAGPFVGRREIAERWRRLSELWDGPVDDEGAGIEAAERLGAYIRALEPILREDRGARGGRAAARGGDNEGACACWSETSASNPS